MQSVCQLMCAMALSCLLSSQLVIGATTNRKYDSEVTNHCPQPSEDVPIPNAHYYTHPRDCRKFVSCAYGLPHVLSCPEKTVFSEEVVSCVHEDGPLTRGIKCPEKEKTDTLCGDNKEQLIPNHKACQRYYDCSDNSSRYYSFLEPFEKECDYPDLFDHVDKLCVPWREARCAPGSEIGVEPCDYVRNQCVAAHCEPCYSRIPSCLGKPDGLNEHPSKLWTPHHVRCEGNRSLEGLWCPNDKANTPFRMLFSPILRSCVSVWEVSRENNGFAPSCEKKDGEEFHVTAESDRVYYKCPGAEVFFCEDGEMFSVEEQKCIRVEEGSTTAMYTLYTDDSDLTEAWKETEQTMETEEPEMSTVEPVEPEITEEGVRETTPPY